MDPKKARICELEFLELCTRLVGYRNKPTDIAVFLNTISPLIDFNPRIIAELSRDIFNIKYTPTKQELAYLLNEKGHNLRDIGKLFNKSSATICLWLQEDLVMFPRCTNEQQSEVIRFMDQYNKLFTSDLRNII